MYQASVARPNSSASAANGSSGFSLAIFSSNGIPTGSSLNIVSPSEEMICRPSPASSLAKAPLPRNISTQRDSPAAAWRATALKSAAVIRGPRTCSTGVLPCLPP